MVALLAASSPTFAAKPPRHPKLLVMIVVDQLGSLYMARYGHLLEGGIQRLTASGAYYPNGEHDYANTATGPGHATIATGAYPSEHGIVNNDWIDERTGSTVYCVGTRSATASPGSLRAPTLADAIRLGSVGRSRVLSIAIKDRAAVLSGGQRPTAVVFYDEQKGAFVSGSYAEKTKLTWLEGFDHVAEAAHGTTWNRLRADVDYEVATGPDETPWETPAVAIGRTFPHALGQGLAKTDPMWLKAYRMTPDALEKLFELAERAIQAEQLGAGPATDVLFIGASSLDFSGHMFGTYAHETLDMLLRTDRLIGELQRRIERRLGRDETVWMLTGDHGMADAPEAVTAFGSRMSRFSIDAMSLALNAELAKLVPRGAQAPQVVSLDPPQVYLRHSPAVDRTTARRALAELLEATGPVIEAHAVEDLGAFREPHRTWFERLIHPGRRADVYVWTASNALLAWESGSNHGSPHVHDQRVPIAFYGPNIARFVDPTPVSVIRIAPTLAWLLGVVPPSAAHAGPLPVRNLARETKAN